MKRQGSDRTAVAPAAAIRTDRSMIGAEDGGMGHRPAGGSVCAASAVAAGNQFSLRTTDHFELDPTTGRESVPVLGVRGRVRLERS